MSMSGPGSHGARDWGVVVQSVPSKCRKDVIKCLEEIFGLHKRDAGKILSNVPLVLMDNVSFGMAVSIKKHFQALGAVVETTNHDVIKKNCLQVLWPQAPDLSFFKNEADLLESSQEKKNDAKPGDEEDPEIQRIWEGPLLSKSPRGSFVIPPTSQPSPEESPEASSSSGGDPELLRRIEELNEKFRKIQEEKQALQTQHAEGVEKIKGEFQQRLEEEKKKNSELAKAYETLQKESPKQEASHREAEAWQAKAVAAEEKICELETQLMQKTSEFEELIQGKVDLTRQFERAMTEAQHKLSALQGREQEHLRKIEELERNVQQMVESLKYRDSVLAQFEKQISELAKMTLPPPSESAESQS
jgi:DNA repair exonuclease SbcCD ATPase subunit